MVFVVVSGCQTRGKAEVNAIGVAGEVRCGLEGNKSEVLINEAAATVEACLLYTKLFLPQQVKFRDGKP